MSGLINKELDDWIEKQLRTGRGASHTNPGHVCVERQSSKSIEAEVWKSLTATAQETLLREGFFPFMGISQCVYDRLPKEAQLILTDNGYFCIREFDLLYVCVFKRNFDDDIDDAIWNQMNIAAQASLLGCEIMPKKGIREVEWDKLSSEMKSLLANNGFYPVLSAAYEDGAAASFLTGKLIIKD